MTATEFRQRLYSVLADLAESGGTVTITHKNQQFRIVPEAKARFVDRLVPHNTLNVPADDLVAAESGASEWGEPKNIDRLP